MKNNKPRAKLLVNFTDGYTEFPQKSDAQLNRLKTVWLLGKDHVGKERIPFGKVIEM